jgi:hypothetical protein
MRATFVGFVTANLVLLSFWHASTPLLQQLMKVNAKLCHGILAQ